MTQIRTPTQREQWRTELKPINNTPKPIQTHKQHTNTRNLFSCHFFESQHNKTEPKRERRGAIFPQHNKAEPNTKEKREEVKIRNLKLRSRPNQNVFWKTKPGFFIYVKKDVRKSKKFSKMTLCLFPARWRLRQTTAPDILSRRRRRVRFFFLWVRERRELNVRKRKGMR